MQSKTIEIAFGYVHRTSGPTMLGCLPLLHFLPDYICLISSRSLWWCFQSQSISGNSDFGTCSSWNVCAFLFRYHIIPPKKIAIGPFGEGWKPLPSIPAIIFQGHYSRRRGLFFSEWALDPKRSSGIEIVKESIALFWRNCPQTYNHPTLVSFDVTKWVYPCFLTHLFYL